MCSKSICVTNSYIYVKTMEFFYFYFINVSSFFLLMCNDILLLTELVCRSISEKGHLLDTSKSVLEDFQSP